VKKLAILLFLILFAIVAVETGYIFNKTGLIKQITSGKKIIAKPLLVYTFANLKKTIFPKNQIIFGAVVSENNDFISQAFYFSVPKTPGSTIMEKVSGLANIPKKAGKYPVIVMFRGYVPDNTYQPGIGTQPVANVLAQNGYITLAPDFLGYGQSAKPSEDPFENRFQTYVTALTLLSSLANLNSGLNASYSGKITADLNRVGIWGHSNGGSIALSTLAINGGKYPTVLWAPVSVSFPYSILYYTDESDDQGKALRKTLADFETNYNTDLFSTANYYNWIKAPLEINQGTVDQEVPYWWSDNLVSILKKDNISVTYLTYPGADHNMLPNGWSDAALNTLDFYNQQFTGK
jgi:dipeptidyl aminopeptidase/acylaminoacyl peptidase